MRLENLIADIDEEMLHKIVENQKCQKIKTPERPQRS